jgi:hypothetical protein
MTTGRINQVATIPPEVLTLHQQRFSPVVHRSGGVNLVGLMPIPVANQPIAEMTRMAFLSSFPFASLDPINVTKALTPCRGGFPQTGLQR